MLGHTIVVSDLFSLAALSPAAATQDHMTMQGIDT